MTHVAHKNNIFHENQKGGFDYSVAFSRNIGWVSEWEQRELSKKTVAIAGMGGVGGAHALALARLGVGGLHLADFDCFDVANMNRQSGAFISTIGMEKAVVMARMARDINPDLRQEVFTNGVDEENLDAFLAGVDLFVDGLDFFVIDIRRKVFARCAELGIPAITAAPIGFGTSYILFMPNQMSFEEYFRFEGLSEEKQYVNFALGLTPKGLHRSYLIEPARIDLAGKRGPSTSAAVQLCSGVVAAEAAKILLKRGKLYPAPAFHQFDAFSGRWCRGYLRHGNNGLLQSLKRRLGYRLFARLSKDARPDEESSATLDIERILDMARWTPSGDNTQPWTFEVVGNDRVIVRITTHADDIYEYDNGRPTILAAGALLETMRIAASRFGRKVQWNYSGCDEGCHVVTVDFPSSEDVVEDCLASYIDIRSVDRRRYRKIGLSPDQKEALERALGDEFKITWYESFSERLRQTKLNMMSSDIRLRSPKAYATHKKVIDWSCNFSRVGIPARAIGLDVFATKIMRWVMSSWERHHQFNRFLFGTALPRIELDLIPGMFCAAHFSVSLKHEPEDDGGGPERLLRAGAAIQRFWLTATMLGLAMQPTISAMIFSYYGRGKKNLLGDKVAMRKAKKLAVSAENIDANCRNWIFRGRIGAPKSCPSQSRSIRLSLRDLIKQEPAEFS